VFGAQPQARLALVLQQPGLLDQDAQLGQFGPFQAEPGPGVEHQVRFAQRQRGEQLPELDRFAVDRDGDVEVEPVRDSIGGVVDGEGDRRRGFRESVGGRVAGDRHLDVVASLEVRQPLAGEGRGRRAGEPGGRQRRPASGLIGHRGPRPGREPIEQSALGGGVADRRIALGGVQTHVEYGPAAAVPEPPPHRGQVRGFEGDRQGDPGRFGLGEVHARLGDHLDQAPQGRQEADGESADVGGRDGQPRVLHQERLLRRAQRFGEAGEQQFMRPDQHDPVRRVADQAALGGRPRPAGHFDRGGQLQPVVGRDHPADHLRRSFQQPDGRGAVRGHERHPGVHRLPQEPPDVTAQVAQPQVVRVPVGPLALPVGPLDLAQDALLLAVVVAAPRVQQRVPGDPGAHPAAGSAAHQRTQQDARPRRPAHLDRQRRPMVGGSSVRGHDAQGLLPGGDERPLRRLTKGRDDRRGVLAAAPHRARARAGQGRGVRVETDGRLVRAVLRAPDRTEQDAPADP